MENIRGEKHTKSIAELDLGTSMSDLCLGADLSSSDNLGLGTVGSAASYGAYDCEDLDLVDSAPSSNFDEPPELVAPE